MLDWHLAELAACFERAKAGKSNAARMAIMAITTNNSIKVNAAGGVSRLAIPGPVDVIFKLLVIGMPFSKVHPYNFPFLVNRILFSGGRRRHGQIAPRRGHIVDLGHSAPSPSIYSQLGYCREYSFIGG